LHFRLLQGNPATYCKCIYREFSYESTGEYQTSKQLLFIGAPCTRTETFLLVERISNMYDCVAYVF